MLSGRVQTAFAMAGLVGLGRNHVIHYRKTLVFAAALLCWSCDPMIEKDDPAPGVRAVFDPTSGTVPLPNDVLRNATKGLLELPITEKDAPLTQYIIQNLNRQDGWLTNQAITLPFDAVLDPASLTTDSVLLVDTSTTPPTKFTPEQYTWGFNIGRAPASQAPYLLTVRTKPQGGTFPKDFEQGHRYALLVLRTAKTTDGTPLVGNPAMELLKSKSPLANAAGRSLCILPDKDAVVMEGSRSASYDPALRAIEDAGIVKRTDIAALTVFTTVSAPRVAFDLLGLLPSPIDRITSLKGPVEPANASLDATPTARLDLAFDVTTAAQAVKFFERTTMTPVAFEATSNGENGGGPANLVVKPASGLKPATEYLIGITDDLKSSAGKPCRPSAYYPLLSAPHPLIDTSTKPSTLLSPFLDVGLDVYLFLNPKGSLQTATADDWTFAYKVLDGNLKTMEGWRIRQQGLVEDMEKKGLRREQFIALWTFTTKASE